MSRRFLYENRFSREAPSKGAVDPEGSLGEPWSRTAHRRAIVHRRPLRRAVGSRTAFTATGCSHEGLCHSKHTLGARRTCSQPRVVLTRAPGCPGPCREAGKTEAEIDAPSPIEKDAGEERGSFPKPRNSGSSA